ncbi:MAG: mandelate racemase/muconate lactonizing enzyme family protein [Segetibacter sp.]
MKEKLINGVEDILRISDSVHENSLDLLQADHTLSGIDIALWDLLGKKLKEPVYSLLGYKKAFAKLPYASRLFGNTPEETYEKAKQTNAAGYQAVKFGWGPFGRNGVDKDIAHLKAAREGMGNNAYLMIDAGTIWGENVDAAKERLTPLKEVNAWWFEEPFINGALSQYKKLSISDPKVPLAGGEGCNNFVQAQAMIDYSGISFIQIDAGRIGGITAAKRVADLAVARNITYVNHTFTSHLALSASLQSFAGIEKDFISEYPVELKLLAQEIGKEKIQPDNNGFIHVPDKPGLGIGVDTEACKKYIVEVEIKVKGKDVFYKAEL